MITYVLILFFHVETLGDADGNSSAVVPGFISQKECQAAGKQSGYLVQGTTFVCVKQTVNK